MPLLYPKDKKANQEQDSSTASDARSLGMAYSLHRKNRAKSAPKASTPFPQEDTNRPKSIAEAIRAKKTKPEQPETLPLEDDFDAYDDFDLLGASEPVEADEAPIAEPLTVAAKILAKRKAQNGL